ncbi:NXPE family member 3-like isoform X2 [Ruditapes philippinarum]|uniref:NXPE family member 3-like isoform X2 n=1 Tax=Ruditapes philippinarum TaxID=129788 RepID=UPI00295BF572|nr:NXPE family member 3-like isoform X2 [Ruditapes philippinarum]
MWKLWSRRLMFICCIIVAVLVITILHEITSHETGNFPLNEQAQPTAFKANNAFRNILQYFQPDIKCKDSLLAADPSFSVIYNRGRRSVFLGEDIIFTIVLYNGYGNPKDTGGDHLRARLFNHSLGAYTPGSIEDHANGTYTVTFPSLWIGNAEIEVEVLYTHEIIGTAIRLRKTWDFSDVFAIFVDNNYTEITTCGPDYKTVHRYSKTSKVCHFAYWNTSQQWFCGRPANNMLCKHWTSITRFLENYTKGISQCEEKLSRIDGQTNIPSNITLKILPRKMDDAFEGTNISCLNYNNTKLWFQDKPSGYFYNNKWIIAHCKGIEHLDGECLRNKTMLFWGDSTLYQCMIIVILLLTC